MNKKQKVLAKQFGKTGIGYPFLLTQSPRIESEGSDEGCRVDCGCYGGRVGCRD